MSAGTKLVVRVLPGLAEVPGPRWDALLDESATPFLRHAWLLALEESGCATPETGWTPRHLTLWRGAELIAAAPAYVRDDSDGDFSRDFDWAHAAERARVAYYPKLVVGVPFTPATGRRFLVRAGEDREACARALVEGAHALCRRERLASLHVLFPAEAEARALAELGLALRVSHQFHWRNEGYQTPDDFLARLVSKKRNMVRRERAAPEQQGIEIRTVRGEELARTGHERARSSFALHRSTVEKLVWGRGWLNLDFYERIFSTMPDALEVVEARRDGALIAGAFNVASPTHLYGRYWGCFEQHPFLHFNVCLYHSIDECIRRRVQVFEGGAGGEHKLARGFLPVPTWSAHAFSDPRLDEAVRRQMELETPLRAQAIARFRSEAAILKPAAAAGAASP